VKIHWFIFKSRSIPLIFIFPNTTGDGTPETRVFIEDFAGLKEYHKKLSEKKYKYNKPGLEKTFWDENVITMEVTDPFKHDIFTERI